MSEIFPNISLQKFTTHLYFKLSNKTRAQIKDIFLEYNFIFVFTKIFKKMIFAK